MKSGGQCIGIDIHDVGDFSQRAILVIILVKQQLFVWRQVADDFFQQCDPLDALFAA